jgi:hypothetical protein
MWKFTNGDLLMAAGPTGSAIPTPVIKKKKQSSWWDWLIERFLNLSEASNIGILFSIIGDWWEPILTVGSGIFARFIYYMDPLIYIFKSLVRITRVVGREAFGIQFEDELGTHKHQTKADLASLMLYGIAIGLFLAAPPVGVTIAWCLAIAGLSITGHFDYAYQEKLAKQKYEAARDNNRVPLPEVMAAHKDYVLKRNSKRLFYGMLLGISLLLICGSAVAFAPPTIVPILFVVAKAASVYLAGIALSRVINYVRSRMNKKSTPPSAEAAPTVVSSPALAKISKKLSDVKESKLANDNRPPNAHKQPALSRSYSAHHLFPEKDVKPSQKFAEKKYAVGYFSRKRSVSVDCISEQLKVPSPTAYSARRM